MSTETVQVAMVSDEAYLPWTATTVLSCIRAGGAGSVQFHLFHPPELSSSARSSLSEMVEREGCRVAFRQIDVDALDVLPSKGPEFGGRMSWARVFVPDALTDLDRAVYLDGDTFVVDRLRPLWDTPLDGALVAAVTNVTERAMHGHVCSLGLARVSDYFNAGVVVVDLEQWRANNTTASLIEFVTRRGTPLPWFDQDAMNVICGGRWLRLHPRWNTMNSFWTWPDLADQVFGSKRVSEAMDNPAVLHFEGPSMSKPWHYLCEHPWVDRYRSTLRDTPWRDVPLEDRTVATRVIARLPQARRLGAYRRLHRLRQRRGALRARRRG